MIAGQTHFADGTAGPAAGAGTPRGRALLAAVLCGALAAGCSAGGERCTVECATSMPPHTVIAVAPALNFSGSPDIDVVKAADLMASELSTLPGIGVVGVNRVLAILAEQGVGQIESPEHALDVCDRIGADAILVFAVTEYDPYTPVVGLVAQVYSRRPAAPEIDPVAASRMARPFPVPPRGDHDRPWAQIQRTFNAAHDEVRREVEEYAKSRNETGSPHGWRRYLVSQEWFLRFCCHAVARDLTRRYA